MEEEKKGAWQFVKWIFKILYSPMNAFEEIVKKPNVKGPILVLLITLPIIMGGQYISATKFFLETPIPENDLWIEKPTNSTSFTWSSNGNITFDNNDYIAGNYSISSFLINSSVIWMHLTNIKSLNCSEDEYSRLSFRIKWINEVDITPNAILHLFSFNNKSNKFELDIRSLVANKTEVWANITVSLATDLWMEEPSNVPSWSNVTGVGFQLMWPNSANLTLKVDGLFFGKYDPYVGVRGNILSVQLVNSLISSIIDFVLKWFLLAALLYLILKSFSDWKGSWRSVFYVVGYVYSASLVYLLVYMLFLFLLPQLFIPYNVWQPYSGEEARAGESLLNIYESGWGGQTAYILMLPWTITLYIWTIGLCTIALGKIHKLSWMKAFLIATGAFILSMLLRAFIPI